MTLITYCSTGAWYAILSVVSNVAVLTNALLIAITSNFVGFEVYTRGGYDEMYDGREDVFPFQPIVPIGEEAADQGLSGYANWSSTSFLVSTLVDGEAFPAFTAQSLEYLSDDGEPAEIIMNGTRGDVALYLPFIDMECIENMDRSPSCVDGNTVQVRVVRYNETENETPWVFSENGYRRFYERQECRSLVVNASSDNASPDRGGLGDCFNPNSTCR